MKRPFLHGLTLLLFCLIPMSSALAQHGYRTGTDRTRGVGYGSHSQGRYRYFSDGYDESDGRSVKSLGWRNSGGRRYVGLRLGLNVSQLNCTKMDAERSSKAGMNFGLAFGLRVGGERSHLYFEPGILYSGKGGSLRGPGYVDGAETEAQDVSIRMHYFEIPIVFKFLCNTRVDGLSVQPFLGGFFSLGLSGKTNYEDSRVTYTTFRDDGFRRGDAGIRVGLGCAYRAFYFDLAYDYGLVNAAHTEMRDFGYDSFDSRAHTGNFSLNVGVNL